MGEKEFVIYLDTAQENRYRHRHVWRSGRVVEFRIQFEALIDGHWHAIVRYDTAHGHAHKDTLHPNAPETKEMYPGYSNAEVLTIGQRDILRNWASYRTGYEKEMRK